MFLLYFYYLIEGVRYDSGGSLAAIHKGISDVTAIALPQHALLRFSGPDAQNFLHGQLTCDLPALQPGSSTYGGYCTPKGRLLATFLLWADADGYTMMLPADIAGPIRKRLSLYVLRSRVKIEDLTADHAIIGIYGTDAAQQLATSPERDHQALTGDGVTIIRVPEKRYLKIIPGKQPDLADGSAAWSGLDIAAGVALITPATQEEFVPQMVNLDLIGGLSYTKGCYPGQEIVARTHYLGKLKQRMYRISVDAPAAPGDKLYCPALGDQAGGMIVSAAPAANGQSDALAVLQTAHARTAPYHLGTLQGPLLALQALPYTIP